MPTPQRGRIVLVEVLDPQGSNPKVRPVVILSSNEDIQSGDDIVGVCISSQLSDANSKFQVELPWHRDGHARTGLRKRSAAMCNWIVSFKAEQIKEQKGVVPDPKMLQILETVDAIDS